MTKSFSDLPSISPSSNNEVVYNGPFIGRARALVDYTPSPYDRDALRFNVSQSLRSFSLLVLINVVLYLTDRNYLVLLKARSYSYNG